MTGSAYVLEVETFGHLPRHPFSKRSYLRVNVREVCEGGPSSNSHDGAIRGTAQLHRHGASGTQTVGRHAVQGVSPGKEAISSGPPSYRNRDVPIRYGRVGPGVDDHSTERGRQLLATKVVDTSS